MQRKLYLIPSFLGNENYAEIFPELNKSIIQSLKTFIVEDERTARRFLKKVEPSIIIDNLNFLLLNEHTTAKDYEKYLTNIKDESIGLLSDAGVPCIADPGSVIVEMAHKLNFQIIPLIGPTSIILALMASGMNGQNFAFNGYLPVKQPQRSKAISFFEKRSITEKQTQIFIEAPYRNIQLFNDFLNTCDRNTKLCIACDVTLESQFIKTKTIDEWKQATPEINKKPAIFLLSK